MNDIINRTGGVMSHMQLTQTYGNVCSAQNYNQLIAALPQKWKRQVEGEKSKELVTFSTLIGKDTQQAQHLHK